MSIPTPKGASCLECPSFLDASKSISRFKKSVSSPVCGRLGKLLGKPDLSEAAARKLLETEAKNCPGYGQPLPATSPAPNFVVTLPDPEARNELPPLDPRKTRVNTCAMCANFVPDEVVAAEFQWPAGLCAAKGKLILPDRKTQEASGCQFREHGRVRRNLDGLHLMPIFNESDDINPIDSFLRGGDSKVEPHEYPTDKPVSADEKANGIRAWRRFDDPEGTGNFVHLPVYDSEHFTPDEREKIPRTGDDEHPELYFDHAGYVYKIAVLWTELDETPAAWGMAGVGKTEIFRHIAWLMGLPFYRFSITGSTELDDLAGKMLFVGNETAFQYGRLSEAWQKPCVIVLDEPNTGPPEVWEFLRPLTDNSKQLTLDSNKGESLKRHPDCYLGMAMNPAWDPKNVGTAVIGDADASRLMHLEFSLPDEKVERSIIKNRVRLDGWEIDEARLTFIMKVAKSIRELCENDTLGITWGIRPQIKVARALRWFGPETAYRMAIADMMEPQQQQALLDMVRAHAHGFRPIKLVKS